MDFLGFAENYEYNIYVEKTDFPLVGDDNQVGVRF
jgi:hypothetical protein